MNEILTLPSGELLACYARGTLSPVEVMCEVLDAVSQLDPLLNSLCALDEAGALEAARASEWRWRYRRPCGALDGLPVSVKDLVAVRGMPTRYGSITSDARPEPHDAPAVARLRAAGALLFAKATTSEFGNKIVTDSPLTGTTRNPWDLQLSPGGSSGGSAAAVAAGFGPMSLATDGGGSIRIPACWSGVVGFKPSAGVVPSGRAGNYTGLSTLGPIARTAGDAALMARALARPVPGETGGTAPSGLLSGPESGLDEGVAGLRVAWCPAPAGVTVEGWIAPLVREAVTLFAQMGAHIEEVEASPLDDYAGGNLHAVQWQAYFAHRVRQMDDLQQAVLDPDLQALVRAAESVDRATLVEALAARHQLWVAMAEFFGQYDLLLTPTFHTGPPPVPGLPRDLRGAPVLTSWCNQTGQPAISVPCGSGDARLPAALQIIGAYGADDLVLRAACAYEAARGPLPLPPLLRDGDCIRMKGLQ